MKTFTDLKFQVPSEFGILRAKMNFANGYGISVVKGPFTYSDKSTYEVAILKNGSLCYDTPITNDVLEYQTLGEIDEIMKELQTYKKDQY